MELRVHAPARPSAVLYTRKRNFMTDDNEQYDLSRCWYSHNSELAKGIRCRAHMRNFKQIEEQMWNVWKSIYKIYTANNKCALILWCMYLFILYSSSGDVLDTRKRL
jgi:hypothetical protein